jgi:hypothetical protein
MSSAGGVLSQIALALGSGDEAFEPLGAGVAGPMSVDELD